MDEEIQLKNIKEFLQNYNKITDDCFSQCVYTLSHSRLTEDEALCANNCVQKAKFVEQKCMQAFIEHQQQSMQKFMEEAAQKQIEQEAAQKQVEQETAKIQSEKEVVDSNITNIENNEIAQQLLTELNLE